MNEQKNGPIGVAPENLANIVDEKKKAAAEAAAAKAPPAASPGVLLPKNLNEEIGESTDIMQRMLGLNTRLQQLYNVAYAELERKNNLLAMAAARITNLKAQIAELEKKPG